MQGEQQASGPEVGDVKLLKEVINQKKKKKFTVRLYSGQWHPHHRQLESLLVGTWTLAGMLSAIEPFTNRRNATDFIHSCHFM